jgi:hypothetical protein
MVKSDNSDNSDMLEQHLNMVKSSMKNSTKNTKNNKKIKPDSSYVGKAKSVLKVRKDQVKQYTNMLSTGHTTNTNNYSINY